VQRISTDDGMTIDFNRDLKNADFSILCNLEPFSNITNSSELQSAKYHLQRILTDGGITIDFNPDPKNADSPISCNFQSFSKMSDSNEPKLLTYDREVTLIDE
jgi:hypothetical protein